MSKAEYCCFIGGLSWSTTDIGLRDAFEKFGDLTTARVVKDKISGRSRGFGFVTFTDQKAMEDAIEAMNGFDLDGRAIMVDKAQPQQSSRDHDSNRDYDHRESSGRRGSGSRECFQCGKPGHFARECPSGDGGRRKRYVDRDDRYSHGGSGNGHYGPDRNGDHHGGRTRDSGGRGGPRNDRYNRDHSGPYERPDGGYRA